MSSNRRENESTRRRNVAWRQGGHRNTGLCDPGYR